MLRGLKPITGTLCSVYSSTERMGASSSLRYMELKIHYFKIRKNNKGSGTQEEKKWCYYGVRKVCQLKVSPHCNIVSHGLDIQAWCNKVLPLQGPHVDNPTPKEPSYRHRSRSMRMKKKTRIWPLILMPIFVTGLGSVIEKLREISNMWVMMLQRLVLLLGEMDNQMKSGPN